MSQYGRQNDGAKSPKLSGKDASGKPLEGHQHAFYLPTDEDGDGQLDHLTVWTPGGLEEREFQVVVSMTTLNPGGGRYPLQLAYQAHGMRGRFRRSLSLVLRIQALAVADAICPDASCQAPWTQG